MQPKLPLKVGLLYECANPFCFYEGSLFQMDEVDWVHFWNSEIDDLDLRSVCPSCAEPMMIWSDEDET